jgi:hypothetical protein
MMRVRELPVPRPSLANPKVTKELDEIGMTALERDPARRWQSAAAMRDRLHAVIAQPGNAMDNQGVIDWVHWVFEQKKGRAPQLTPIMPMPIRVAPSVTRDLTDDLSDELLEEAPTVAGAPITELELEFAWTLPVIVWLACAGAIVLLVLGSIVWKIVG